MILQDNERIDEVNEHLRLIQKKDGLTFGTDALLLASYITKRYGRALEIGSGSGIISMLLLTREKVKYMTAIEVQPEYARLTQRNADLNGLSDRLDTQETDIRDYAVAPHTDSFDLVISNPPYMKADSGKANALDRKNAARHEVFGTVFDICQSAGTLLRYGGTLAMVYRPDRLSDLFAALQKAKTEPKQITFVHADIQAKPSMILLLAKKGGKADLRVTRPLVIYSDATHTTYTPDMTYIMESGVIPPSLS